MTPKEMEARIQELTSMVKDIDTQLSQTRRYDEAGNEWPAARYHKWRHSALYAKRQIEKEMAPLKAALKEERRSRHALTVTPGPVDLSRPLDADPVLLFAHAYKLLKRLASEGVDLDPNEQAVVDAMLLWLQHGNHDTLRSI